MSGFLPTVSHVGITAHGRVVHIKPDRAKVLGPARCGTTGMIWYSLAENSDFAERVGMPYCRRCGEPNR